MLRTSSVTVLAFLAGIITTILVSDRSSAVAARTNAEAHAPDADTSEEIAAVQAEIAMQVVDYHTTCLWFAGKAENWPLAEYYWGQIALHMQRSAKSHRNGANPKLVQALKAIEAAPSMQVEESIRKKDLRSFNLTYRSLLQGCYNCHKAAGAAFLRPRMPLPPFQSIITVDPKELWPE
jgi:hypothetical protein